MKKRTRRFTFFAAFLAMLLLSGMTVFAAKLKLETHTYWAGAPYSYTVFTENLPDNATLVSARSSNPKVLSIEKWGDGKWDCAVSPLKPGKSKVTVTYKIGKAKKTVSGVFTVKKYPNAIKKLTYNKKAVNLKKNPFNVDLAKKAKKKSTIKVTPAKGWKVVNPIEILSEGCSYKLVKNGKPVSISLKKPRVAALITMENTRNETFQYFIDLTPDPE